MENTGEDSGLDCEDNSNIVEDSSLQQNDGLDETDEGISEAGNVSNLQFGVPCFMPRMAVDNEGEYGDIQFIQNQQFQQQEFVQVYDEANNESSNSNNESSNSNNSNNSNSNSGFYEQQLQLQEQENYQQQQQLQQQDEQSNNSNYNDGDNSRDVEPEVGGGDLIGDDNNNDRPDDVNNNTTDPQMQQLQQEQIQQRLLLQQQQQEQQFQQFQQQQEQQQEEEGNDVDDSEGQDSLSNETSNNEIISTPTTPSIQSLQSNEVKGKDKKKKKKKKKKNRFVTVVGADGVFKKQNQCSLNNDEDQTTTTTGENGEQNENDLPGEEVEIEYIPEKLELSVFDPMYRAFANVFENFRITETRNGIDDFDEKAREEELLSQSLKKVPKPDDDDELEDQKNDEKPKLSKRKLKKLTRLSIAELKQVVPRPDVVEMHDVTARDPKLLVHLKSYRNTVPVPRHWCYKRKYLQGKRGIEKAPFDLPAFIKKTGIMEMRAALAEKEETKNLKAKMREKVRPKMGKIDIDYQKLHDAFFKWQSKPKMTIHGDLYYEGKEFETRMKDKKPGELSDDLRTALGMPVGPNSHRVPPPWLIAMQRYGPPPSYPHLKVSGLNAPIPEGCTFGYHAGGWGKPPVDEFGRPLYGDVFGVAGADATGALEEDTVDKTLWGELESEEEIESEEEEEEEDEEKEEEGEGAEEAGLQTPVEGLITPSVSGFSSVPAGLETPDTIELRKKRIEQEMEGNDTPALYTVLPEKRVDRIGGSMMASTHVYDLTGVKDKGAGVRGLNLPGQDQGRVELNLDPSELDLVDNEGTLAARYEQHLKEQQSHLQKEDLSDMVAEHAAKQKSKRKRQNQQQDGKAKKLKEFKF